MSAVLEVKNLTKVFSLGSLFSRLRIKAVDQISFTVKPAEIFTLAGESGYGKTSPGPCLWSRYNTGKG